MKNVPWKTVITIVVMIAGAIGAAYGIDVKGVICGPDTPAEADGN